MSTVTCLVQVIEKSISIGTSQKPAIDTLPSVVTRARSCGREQEESDGPRRLLIDSLVICYVVYLQSCRTHVDLAFLY